MNIYFYSSEFPYYLSIPIHAQRERTYREIVRFHAITYNYTEDQDHSGHHKGNMLSLPNFTTCPTLIRINVDFWRWHIHTYICIYNYSITQHDRTYSNFKQNFTSIVESHMLILKPTITFFWFFSSKWFFS